MIHPRLVVCLLLKNGLLVRSQLFKVHQIIGNPISTVHRLSNWNVDELIILDISRDDYHDMRRDDLFMRYGGTSTTGILGQIADVCFMPLAFGGRIRSLDDIRKRLSAGADKVIINTQALRNPGFISEAARQFGSQCIVVSIDAQRGEDGSLEVYGDGGREASGMTPSVWAKQVEQLGAGEIFLNSIDRDGMGQGLDLDLISGVTSAVSIPVISCGGAGHYDHLPPAITEGASSAVAAANIFHFFEVSYPLAKQACLDAGIPMRPVVVDSKWYPREPVYDLAERDERIAERLTRARQMEADKAPVKAPRQAVSWCRSCLYPSLSATPMEYDEKGVCMGCRMSEVKGQIPPEEWERRANLLAEMIQAKSCPYRSRHDCIIAVSGGKDSYFQTHFIRNVLGFKPLLVTYYGNNFSDAGERNLRRMKEVFDVDHIIHYPSVNVLKKLNKLGFILMGDMNWHGHAGIASVPMRTAVEKNIPFVIWGEHGYADLCGQFAMNDFVEWSYRNRLEHYGRGYEWNYFLGLEGLRAEDMDPWKYPTDTDILRVGLRGLHLGNYVHWEANAHTALVREKYGFEIATEPFDRTYRTMSNLDDIHENGAHDYLKFIKFGYGRCTDHASKDVRAGLLSRGQALSLIRRYDHVKPRDLQRWFAYAGMKEAEFDAIADTFRDPRVWRRENGEWLKDEIWDSDVIAELD